MATGPVEAVIASLPGHRFSGETVPEPVAPVESGTSLDVTFVGKS